MTQNGQCVYIDDGYTLEGFIAAERAAHGALRFTYRPLLVRPRVKAITKIAETQDPSEREEYAAGVVAKQITNWSFTDRAGKSVPISADAMLDHMEPRLYHKLRDVVLGLSASDEDPEGKSYAEQETVDAKN